MWEMIWPVLTIAVTLLGVAVAVLTAAEPLLVAVAEKHPERDPARRHRHVHLRHRSDHH
jgi:hypothetical protein